jgi:hypothetical protein
MCHFVFIGVREQFESRLRSEMVRAGFETTGSSNPSLIAAFPVSDRLTVVTRGGCSCGLCGDLGEKFDEAAERLKYQKKGWSPSKVERAILGRRPRAQPPFVAFRETFAGIVRLAGAARIMAHCFSGDVESEVLEVGGRHALHLDEYLERDGVYEDDLVHDVVFDQAGRVARE